MHNKYLLFAILVYLSTNYSFSQRTTSENNDDTSVPFYKWEFGIDLLPLVDKAKDPFGYILKRNFQSASGRQALRLKLLPKFIYSPLLGGRENNSGIYLAVGYEWQRLYNRFAVLYGFDPYFNYDQNKVTSTTSGVVVEQRTFKVGVNGFIGGRYYLGKHIALTLETHLIYQYYDFKAVDNSPNSSLGGASQQLHQLYLNPINTVYLSYHF